MQAHIQEDLPAQRQTSVCGKEQGHTAVADIENVSWNPWSRLLALHHSQLHGPDTAHRQAFLAAAPQGTGSGIPEGLIQGGLGTGHWPKTRQGQLAAASRPFRSNSHLRGPDSSA